jgi:hypothetical protein
MEVVRPYNMDGGKKHILGQIFYHAQEHHRCTQRWNNHLQL